MGLHYDSMLSCLRMSEDPTRVMGRLWWLIWDLDGILGEKQWTTKGLSGRQGLMDCLYGEGDYASGLWDYLGEQEQMDHNQLIC